MKHFIITILLCGVAIAQTTSELTDKAPAAKPALARYESQVTVAQKKHDEAVSAARTDLFFAVAQARQDLIKTLEDLKEAQTRAGKLDAAVALRDAVAELKLEAEQAKPTTPVQSKDRTAEELNKLLAGTRWASSHTAKGGDKNWIMLNADHTVTVGWHDEGGAWAAVSGNQILLQAYTDRTVGMVTINADARTGSHGDFKPRPGRPITYTFNRINR